VPSRLAPGEWLHHRRIVGCHGCIFGGSGFQFLELQFHLVEQLAPALGGGTEAILPQPRD
jgi:hypothetical protein